ncbi:MAG TPA: hypothetical protein VGE86_07110 [Thermoanaerobaculia bacterium]
MLHLREEGIGWGKKRFEVVSLRSLKDRVDAVAHGVARYAWFDSIATL